MEVNILFTNKKTIEFIGVISGIIVILCAIATIIVSYLISLNYFQPEIEIILQAYYYDRAIFASEAILYLIVGIFMVPSIFGIFFFIRKNSVEKEKISPLIPLIFLIIGYLIIISLYIFKLFIIFEIASRYFFASISEKNEIIAYVEQSDLIFDILVIIATIANAIGIVLFGIIMNQNPIFNKAVVWTAYASGICSLGVFGNLIIGTFGTILLFINQVGIFLFYLWLGYIFFIILKTKLKKEKTVE
ncbi:MAG TPA: hypothetical protein VMX55_06395 [candidate division Zixibacteria bacterium]|nr:hypothetical protein [candidate division Zixibacteria bacterium]